LLLSEDGTSARAQFYGQAYWHKMYLTTYRVRYMNSHPRCGASASAPRAEALCDIVNLNATVGAFRLHPAGALAAQARQRDALTSRRRA
jgi:hypothetical protein